MTRIAILQGHPTRGDRHLCHALAGAYAEGARAAGHEVDELAVADMEFSVLRSRRDWETACAAPDILRAQESIRAATHVVIAFPLWLGSMPALLKAFLEQTFRPGFATGKSGEAKGFSNELAGRSARIIVTMGMPSFVYRWYFLAHGIKSLERGILKLVGIKPVRRTLVGSVESLGDAGVRRWLNAMRRLGAAAK